MLCILLALHTAAQSQSQPSVRPRRRWGGLLLVLILILALIGGVAYPPAFLFAVRQTLGFEAWRYGFHLAIGSMDGSANGPIWLYDVHLSHESGGGATTMIGIEKAHTTFAWQHLLWQRDARVWHDLTLDGMSGTIDLPAISQRPKFATPALFLPLASTKTPRLLLPSSLTISRANLTIRERYGLVRLQDIDLQASDVETGHLVIGLLSIQEPWMNSSFSDCRGSLLIQDSKLLLTGMKLTDSLSVNSASADLPELLRGQLQMDFALDAFSGDIQGAITSSVHDQHLIFDSSGTFSNISVAQLGAFFGQNSDGSITEGKFTFHGSPRDLKRTTFTTYFKAGNFRWGARRWNSLVAGVTYVDRELSIHDFELQQAHNSLTLKGHMAIPENWREWWKTDFSLDEVAARIDNLTELSALLGPSFGAISGKLAIDGSVRGENASFNGQLIVSGSHLSFRSAPLDQLRAAIKLRGNEIQVTTAEFTHGDDYLRADGVVNILGRKRYWGEVKAAVADLSLYAAFLQPPIAPEAFGGGLTLDWSGDGVSSAHSGAFTVRLNRLRPLLNGTAGMASWQPIDLSAEATYSPESIFFSNLTLGNGETSLASRVIANPRSLTFQNLKLLHGRSLWLTGDAQIPLNVWAAWQAPASASWWNFQSPCILNLNLNHLSVGQTLFLSGRQQPFDGEISGAIKSDGTLAKLTAAGHLSIRNASGTSPAGALKSGNAILNFSGSQLVIPSASGQWNGLPWTASGSVAGPDVRAPNLDLVLHLPSTAFALGRGMEGSALFDLHAAGQPSTLTLSGTAQMQSLKINRTASIQSLVTDGAAGFWQPLQALELAGPPDWKLNIQISGDTAVELNHASGHAVPAFHLGGTIIHPTLTGSFALRDFTVTEGSARMTITNGSFTLNPSNPAATALNLHATGSMESQSQRLWGDSGLAPLLPSEPFDGYIYGTLARKRFTWNPQVTARLARPEQVSPIPPLKNSQPFSGGAVAPATQP